MFNYPQYLGDKKTLSEIDGINKDMMMDIDLYLWEGKKTFYSEDKETAILLLSGKIELKWLGKSVILKREDVFTEEASCLHCPKGVKIEIKTLVKSEIIVQKTLNDKDFPCKVYYPQDIDTFVSCEAKWEGTAARDVKTVFDYSNAPYSNMVLGEVVARQGRWWSYIPHSHPQPEVYYYKFQRPEGFGACFIGETAYTIKDGSCGAFPGGYNHPQVTAPGYPMYCCWMIRHLPNNPWTDRIDDERYTWLNE